MLWAIGASATFIGVVIYLVTYLPSTEESSRVPRYVAEPASPDRFHTFFVIAVVTGLKYSDRRDAIRETWFSDLPEDVLPLFFIGSKGLTVQEQGALEYEKAVHKDIILLEDFKDSYYSLSEKVTRVMKWLFLNVEFSFLLKADDDTYARVDMLYKELKKQTAARFYWGFFDGRARVKHSGKWSEKGWKLCDTYLPHARGGGYVLSQDLVEYIARNSDYLQMFKSEDISVGAWLGPLAINRQHDPRFDTEYKSRGCNNAYIVTHKQDVKMIREKHQLLKQTGRLCRREVKVMPSYIYNWNVPPSQCCLRNNTSVP